jgi:anti-sigma factor (TIGR02949 family)
MTCAEVREVLYAFLDNELDAPLSIEVQRHMERCPECACEAETERAIRKRLARAVERGSAESPGLEEVWSAALASTSPRRVRQRARPRAWAAAAVGVAATIALVFFGHRWIRLERASPKPGGLAELLVADFEHFLNEGRPVQIASADRGEVSQWLLGRTGLAVSLPATKGHCKLTGARRCRLDGQPAAFASYEMETNPACLVVLAGGMGAVDNLERVSHDGRTFWVDRRRGHSVVACVRDDLIYAAVSRTEADALIHFMSGLE